MGKPTEKWEGPFYRLAGNGWVANIEPQATDGNKVMGWKWEVRNEWNQATGKEGTGKSLQHAMMLAEQAAKGP